MGFYIRKSIKAGPFRFNLSKSGIGVSAGIPGFRVGSGPRGNYIHMGRGGFYYRQTLKESNSVSPAPIANANNRQPVQGIREEGHNGFVDIESASVSNMRDTNSDEILKEFDSKQKKFRTLPLLVGVLLGVGYFLPPNTQSVAYASLSFVGIVLGFAAWNFDQARKSVVLFYNLEQEFEEAFIRLHSAFSELSSVSKAWHIQSKANVTDWKRNAGADHLVKRSQVSLTLKDAPFVKTNIPIPSIPVGKQTLFFFPDRLLVFEKNGVGAVHYSDLKIDVSQRQFIESDGIPRDARVVDHTWRFVNRTGGPDRRFNNNTKIPICLYEYVHLSSISGLNELLSFSKLDIGNEFKAALTNMAKLLSKKSQ